MIVWREADTMYPGEIVYVPRPGSTEEDDGKPRFHSTFLVESQYCIPPHNARNM